MNRSGAAAVCLTLGWVSSISSLQPSMEPPARPGLLKAIPGRHKGWGWELMKGGGRADNTSPQKEVSSVSFHTGVAQR